MFYSCLSSSSNNIVWRNLLYPFGNFNRIVQLSHYAIKMKPNTVYFRNLLGTEQFEFSFLYINEQSRINKQFSFKKANNEPIAAVFAMITKKLTKILTRKKSTDTDCLDGMKPSMTIGNVPVEATMECKAIFKHGNDEENIKLNIFGTAFDVVLNSPWVRTLVLPSVIICGCPVYFKQCEFINTTRTVSKYEWYTSADRLEWEKVGDGYPFTPQRTDINKFLKCSCLPISGTKEGTTLEVVCKDRIVSAPEEYPFDRRHRHTAQPLSGKQFRVVSYNLLADLYSNSVYAREMLFPYCPVQALDMDVRRQLLFKEILGYNADIVCLQETDEKIFKYFKRIINEMDFDYDGEYAIKGGLVKEGLALFYNKTNFCLIDHQRVVLSNEIATNPIFSTFWNRIETNPILAKRLNDRTNVLQVAVFQSRHDQNEILVVANTHLYFHPEADNIRLIQSIFNLFYIEDVIRKLKEKEPSKRISTVFCGDLNSTPDCGVYALYTTGRVPADCVDFNSNPEDVFVAPDDLSQSIIFDSAYEPHYPTNFTRNFAECIDYIFYEKSNFRKIQTVPMPTNEELKEHEALPSIKFPSDHVALICDLEWN